MDEIITDVRKIRDQIVKEFDNNLHSLCEEIRQCEKQHKSRLVNLTIKDNSNSSEMNDYKTAKLDLSKQ